ncbi:MAG: hypothetical protein HY547_06370, partial [Elusimicrobia bacterium]|nr:hypothetical protein [Elusimicrobiota bacterium]
GSTVTLANPFIIQPYSDVSTSSLRINWLLNGNPEETNAMVELSLRENFSTLTQTSITATGSSVLNGLIPNTTYYARVKARNHSFTETVYTSAASTVTLANPPAITSPTFPQIWVTSLTILWDANSNPPGTIYTCEISTSDVFWPILQSSVTLQTQSIFEHLTSFKLHYFRAKATNHLGIDSIYSRIGSTATLENIQPRPPKGLSGSWNNEFTLIWSPVLFNADGSPNTDLGAYRIYRSTSDAMAYELIASVSSTTLSWTDPVSALPQAQYYMLVAIDINLNASATSYLLLSEEIPKIIIKSADGGLTLRVPSHLLTKSDSPAAEDLLVAVTRQRPLETGRTITSYAISLSTEGGATLSGLNLNNVMEGLFRIPVQGTNFASIAPQAVDPARARNTSIYLHNGAEWVRLGGKINEQEYTLAHPINRSGTYALRSALEETEFAILSIEPRKIFTPTGPSPNNQFTIRFANPRDSQASQSRIHNLDGAHVSDFKVGSDGASFYWDGRDFNNNLSPSGVYLYQLIIEGKTFNGTVVVAR